MGIALGRVAPLHIQIFGSEVVTTGKLTICRFRFFVGFAGQVSVQIKFDFQEYSKAVDVSLV